MTRRFLRIVWLLFLLLGIAALTGCEDDSPEARIKRASDKVVKEADRAVQQLKDL